MPGELSRLGLNHDLARHLRDAGWLTFTEVVVPGTGDGADAGRVDVVAVKPHHYARKDMRAYEVKSSWSDFQRDVASQKWRRYLLVFHRVFFAVPTGLVKAAQIPADAGLIVRGEKGWTTVKSARSHSPSALTAEAVLALLYRGYEEHRAHRDLRTRMAFTPGGDVETCRTWGWEISRRLREKKADLEEPLQELLEVVYEFLGQEPDALAIGQAARGARHILQLAKEFDRDGGPLEAIATYLFRLRQTYGLERVAEARESVFSRIAALVDQQGESEAAPVKEETAAST